MTTLLPRDGDNNAIMALGFKDGGAHTISVAGVSARNTTAFDTDTRVIGIYATGDIYIALGDNTIAATSNDHFIPADTYMDIAIGGGKSQQYTHIAGLRVTSDCTLYISEKE